MGVTLIHHGRGPDRVVTMEACPSLNQLWVRAPGQPRVKSEAYRQWIERAGWQVRQQMVGAETIAGRFDCLMEVPVSRRDSDNWAKATLDLMETAQVVSNDGNLNDLMIRPVDRTDVMVALWERPDLGGVRKPAAPRGRGARRERKRAAPGLSWMRPGGVR